jgi:hypothetical protein
MALWYHGIVVLWYQLRPIDVVAFDLRLAPYSRDSDAVGKVRAVPKEVQQERREMAVNAQLAAKRRGLTIRS